MKKNNKGFTLIELLAVIVILAIIALIATPIVLNMISNAKKSAARSSALGYVDAVEYNIQLAAITPELSYNKKFDGMLLTIERKQLDDAVTTSQKGINVADGIWDAKTINAMEGFKIKGKKPTSGYILIKNRKVAGANLCMTDYFVQYTGTDASAARKCTSEEKDGTMDDDYKTSYKDASGNDYSDYDSSFEPESASPSSN